jgi:hypothetical protein
MEFPATLLGKDTRIRGKAVLQLVAADWRKNPESTPTAPRINAIENSAELVC